MTSAEALTSLQWVPLHAGRFVHHCRARRNKRRDPLTFRCVQIYHEPTTQDFAAFYWDVTQKYPQRNFFRGSDYLVKTEPRISFEVQFDGHHCMLFMTSALFIA